MKNVLFLGFLLICLSPLSALATSGACSGHGGVSCASGPDSDGSVICNDGWENSSVSYSNMVMCRGYSTAKRVARNIAPVAAPIVTPKPLTPPIVKKEVIPTPTKTVPPTATVATPPIAKAEPVKATVTASSTSVVQPTPIQTVTPSPIVKSGFWKRLFSSIF